MTIAIELSKNTLTGDKSPAPRSRSTDHQLLTTNQLPRPRYPPARTPTRWKGKCRGHLGIMVTLATTAAADLVATLEVGACGALFVSRAGRLICR